MPCLTIIPKHSSSADIEAAEGRGTDRSKKEEEEGRGSHRHPLTTADEPDITSPSSSADTETQTADSSSDTREDSLLGSTFVCPCVLLSTGLAKQPKLDSKTPGNLSLSKLESVASKLILRLTEKSVVGLGSQTDA